MKKGLNISERDKKLILLLILVAVAVLPYFLVTQKVIEKNRVLASENAKLKDRKTELEGYAASQETYISESEEMLEKTRTYLGRFPSDYTQESELVLMNRVETNIAIELYQTAFGEDIGAQMTSEAEEEEIKAVEEETGEESDDGHVVSTLETEKVAADLTRLKASTKYSYRASYEGLKKFLDYIKHYRDRMVISELTGELKEGTGFIEGTFKLDQYALMGDGRDNFNFTPPQYRKGTENVFFQSSGLEERDPDAEATAYTSDFFLLVNQPGADMDAVIVGQTSDTSRDTYVTNDVNASHSVVITFAGEDGDYEAFYTIDGKSEEAETVPFTATDDIRFAIMSSSRADGDDAVTVDVKINNDTDLSVTCTVSFDDERDPRITTGYTGDVSVR
ncbi:MAG: hypothetical protein K6F53_08855 [Lachnospiraceae bacterium]|nr:hypothetical protein [Lachnospiraceae bacterium]